MPDAATEPKSESPAVTNWPGVVGKLTDSANKWNGSQWAWILLATFVVGLMIAVGIFLAYLVRDIQDSRQASIRFQYDVQERMDARDAVQRSELAKERAIWEASNLRLAVDINSLKTEIVRLILSLDRITRKLPPDDATDPP